MAPPVWHNVSRTIKQPRVVPKTDSNQVEIPVNALPFEPALVRVIRPE